MTSNARLPHKRSGTLALQGGKDVSEPAHAYRTAVDPVTGAVDLKLAEATGDILKWMVGIAAGQLGLLFALVRLFPGGH